MNPTVVIAYNEFSDLAIEQKILDRAGVRIVRVPDYSIERILGLPEPVHGLMVTIQPVTRELLLGLKECRIIGRAGTGLDAIDIATATAQGIWVTNVPDYAVDEVSTHAIALLLSFVRHIPELIESTRRGEWDTHFVRPIPRLRGQTLGLVGFGRIARATAVKAAGLGLDVIAYDPYLQAAEIEAAGVRAVDWETLLAHSDYLSLHVPLTNSTRQIINAAALVQMKPGAFLINTARGGLVDDVALLDAVRAGRIAGAALDVLPVEPPTPDYPLLHEPRIRITPHIAWYSEEANYDVRARAAEDVVRVLRGERPRNPVNEPRERTPLH